MFGVARKEFTSFLKHLHFLRFQDIFGLSYSIIFFQCYLISHYSVHFSKRVVVVASGPEALKWGGKIRNTENTRETERSKVTLYIYTAEEKKNVYLYI